MKERFIKDGNLDNFQPHEVLELALFYAIPQKNVNDLGHILLNQYGSITNVLQAPYEELLKIKGIGDHAATFLKLVLALHRRLNLESGAEKEYLNSTEDMVHFAKNLFTGQKKEAFYMIHLNQQNQLNFVSLINEGTITEVSVYLRNVVEEVIRHDAVHVILTHNHPSQNTKPSNADISLTRKIQQVLAPLSIQVLDHIIVAGDQYFSFAEKNLL